MILQALSQYYDRLKQANLVCEEGYMLKSVHYQLILSEEGELLSVVPMEQREGKRKWVPEKIIPLIPDPRSGKSGYQKVGFMIDKSDYLLGHFIGGDKQKYADVYRNHLETCWQATHHPNVKAVLNFVDALQAGSINTQAVTEILNYKPGSPILDLRISGQENSVWDVPELREWYAGQQGAESEMEGESGNGEMQGRPTNTVLAQCLVTGHQNVPIEKVHGTLTAGLVSDNNAALVSFNKSAFESYGRKQSLNAPVSREGRLSYMGALKYIFGKESSQKLRLADSVAGFWAEVDTPFEQDILSFFESDDQEVLPITEDKSLSGNRQMSPLEQDAVKTTQSVYKTPYHGGKLPDLSPYLDDGTRFYVLGLAPNVARLSVRFWYGGSIAVLARNIQQHFIDLTIVPNRAEVPFLSLNRLIATTCVKDELKHANPRLAGELMQAILNGAPYPQSILSAVVARMKASRDINYQKAAILKAVLNRYARFYPHTNPYQPLEAFMDSNNLNIGYRMGRWFATMERLQEAAQPGINSTIRDRFFSSAMSTPLVVFSRLEKLSKAHLGKLSGGLSHWYLTQLQEVLADVQSIPTQLNLTDQAQFALGYYHQRQYLFTKKDEEAVTPTVVPSN